MAPSPSCRIGQLCIKLIDEIACMMRRNPPRRFAGGPQGPRVSLVSCPINKCGFSAQEKGCGKARSAGNTLSYCQGTQRGHSPSPARPSGVGTIADGCVAALGNMPDIPCGLRLALGDCAHSEPHLFMGQDTRTLCFIWRTVLRTAVYIDGFNFYYGAVKNTSYKWLDLKLLCQTILTPHHQIVLLNYFTAKAHSTAKDPDAPNRQEQTKTSQTLHTRRHIRDANARALADS